MALLRIIISGQDARLIDVDDNASGTAGRHTVVLESIDESWNGFELSAVFRTSAGDITIPFIREAAVIPAEAMGDKIIFFFVRGTKSAGERVTHKTTNHLIKEITDEAKDIASEISTCNDSAGDITAGEPDVSEIDIDDAVEGLICQTPAARNASNGGFSQDMPVNTVIGRKVYIEDASDMALKSINIYGKTGQDGIPAPLAPAAVQSAGSEAQIYETGKNVINIAVSNVPAFFVNGSHSEGVYTRIYRGITWVLDLNEQTLSLNGTCNQTGSISMATAFNLTGIDWFGYEYVAGSYTPSLEENKKPQVWIKTLLSSAVNLVPDNSAFSVPVHSGALSGFSFRPVNNDIYNNFTIRFLAGSGSVPSSVPIYSTPQLFSLDTPMRGIKTDQSWKTYTDESGQGWYADSIEQQSGKLFRRIGEVTFDGSENWTVSANYGFFQVALGTQNKHSLETEPYCSRFERSSSTTGSQLENERFMVQHSGSFAVRYDAITGTDAAARLANWKAWLAANNLTLVYGLDTPVEEALDDSQRAALSSLHTYMPHSTVSGTGCIETDYWQYSAIMQGRVIDVRTFGLRNDGVSDNSPALALLLKAMKPEIGKVNTPNGTTETSSVARTLLFTGGVYCFSEPITFVDNCHIVLDNAELRCTASESLTYFVGVYQSKNDGFNMAEDYFIKGNGVINASFKANTALAIGSCKHFVADGIRIRNFNECGLYVGYPDFIEDEHTTCYEVKAHSLHIANDIAGVYEKNNNRMYPIAPYAVGIKDGFRGNDWRKVSGGDSFFSDIVLCNLYCGIEAIRGGSVYSGIHMWNAFPTSYDSYFARLHRGGFIQMNGIFLDTLKYGFYSDSQSDLCVLLSNMSWLSVRDDNNAKTVFGFNANTRYNVSGVFLKEEGSGTAAATANLSGSVFSNVLTYGTVAGLNYLPS